MPLKRDPTKPAEDETNVPLRPQTKPLEERDDETSSNIDFLTKLQRQREKTTKRQSERNSWESRDANGGPTASSSKLVPSNTALASSKRYATHYNMRHHNRGFAIILNHQTFDLPNLKERMGTSADANNLFKVLSTLGFQVVLYNDCCVREIRAVVEEYARKDHSKNDCIAFFILTHGDHGILYARDAEYNFDIIWSEFTSDICVTLAGKPKLFFIQACQGDKLDCGITLSDCNITETDGKNYTENYRIPTHADFLIGYSTIPGFYSWRNTTRGSWYMQALCEVLRESGQKYDILTLLTYVSQRVALDFESNSPDLPHMHQQKQIPCITSMLTRLLKFGDK